METRSQTAKFAFYYLLSLVGLVFTAIGTGTAIFQVINKYIPDVLELYQGTFDPGALKFAISALVIAAPIYFIVTRQIFLNLKSGALEAESAVRRWLTYFILLVSSIVMIVWLIMTVNSFLDGELTVKFALKALTAIGIAAAIFGFYLYDIRRNAAAEAPDQVIRYSAYAALAFVLFAFGFGVFNVESPAEARLRRADELVINDFENLNGMIESFYNNRGALPATLESLREEYNYLNDDTLVDPVTNEPYEYKTVNDREYELCAVFRTDNTAKDAPTYDRYRNDRWPHQIGKQCLKQKVTDYSGPASKAIPAPGM